MPPRCHSDTLVVGILLLLCNLAQFYTGQQRVTALVDQLHAENCFGGLINQGAAREPGDALAAAPPWNNVLAAPRDVLAAPPRDVLAGSPASFASPGAGAISAYLDGNRGRKFESVELTVDLGDCRIETVRWAS